MLRDESPAGVGTIHWMLLPYTFGPNPFPKHPAPAADVHAYFNPKVSVYTSHVDPSLTADEAVASRDAKCSYSANAQVFSGRLKLPVGVGDGLSNTMSFAERYYVCLAVFGREVQDWTTPSPILSPPPRRSGLRRATFADPGCADVVPVNDPRFPGRTLASQPGRTFQDRPRIDDADGKLLQSPHPSGLPVALFDGSVRTLSTGISEQTFWGLITPNGGEVVGDF